MSFQTCMTNEDIFDEIWELFWPGIDSNTTDMSKNYPRKVVSSPCGISGSNLNVIKLQEYF